MSSEKLPYRIFDSHAHYYDERFSEEYDGGASALLDELFESGVYRIVNIGTNNENSRLCVEQALKYEGMYAACGIHPDDCMTAVNLDDEISALASFIGNKEKAKKEKKIVAIGEIGLDYHYDNTDIKRQRDFFRAQLELADKLDIPVIIHDRDAHGDCLDVIKDFPNVRGVFHSYSGSADMARELCKKGWYISFSGVLTFKNARKTVESAAAVPKDRILLETDCPYLAPVPFRGKLNHSGYVVYIIEKLSEILNMSPQEVAELSICNSNTFFEI